MNEIIIVENYKNIPVEFTGDAYVNITRMCTAFGKRTNDWRCLPSTKKFEAALAEELKSKPENLVSIVKGGDIKSGNSHSQGVWAHPDLALECARWLSPEFAIWCNRTIRDIMAGRKKLVPANSIEYPLPTNFAEALELAARIERGRIKAEDERLRLTDVANAAQQICKDLGSQIKEIAPKAELYTVLADAEGTYSNSNAAKLMFPGKRFGEHKLMAWLRDNGFYTRDNIAIQRYLDAGLFRQKVNTYEDPYTRKKHTKITTRITLKGIEYLSLSLIQMVGIRRDGLGLRESGEKSGRGI